jgi:hypothetical protein
VSDDEYVHWPHNHPRPAFGVSTPIPCGVGFYRVSVDCPKAWKPSTAVRLAKSQLGHLESVCYVVQLYESSDHTHWEFVVRTIPK